LTHGWDFDVNPSPIHLLLFGNRTLLQGLPAGGCEGINITPATACDAFPQMEYSSPYSLANVDASESFRGESPMSRREYARRSTLSAQLRQMLNAAAVIATCAAAAFVGAAI
jgi:hypothetical protein